MKFKKNSTVRLKKLRKQFHKNELWFGIRSPIIGDIAAIVDVYEKPSLGYELECIDKNGVTLWLSSFSPEDAEFELINEST